MSSAKRTSTALRRAGAMRDQTPLSKAARALATACSASASSQLATWVSSRPSTGLMQSNTSPFAAGV